MDRQIIYPGQVPLETDLLLTNQNTMVALAKLSQAIFGTSGVAVGFGTTQTTVPSMAVLVAPGEIYSQQNLEATAISSLPQDLVHSVVKQGILLDAATIPLSAPGTAGFSINYLIQVGYQDSDSGSAVLPYYNASNPSVAYAGPANSGTAQPTIRKGVAVVTAKAGTAATTGTQTTPAPDSGKLGLFVVTVANGASTIVNANISAYAGSPVLPSPIVNGRLIARRVFSTTQVYTPTPGTNSVDVLVIGGGGAGGGAAPNGAGAVSAGAGGAGGGWARRRITSGFSGVTITIGAGGTGVIAGTGGSGGTTSFGALVSATGGSGGTAGASAGSGTNSLNGSSVGGAGASGDMSAVGSAGFPGFYAAIPIGGYGGSSLLGGGGLIASGTSAGNAGTAPGGGGGGGCLSPSTGGGASGGAGVGGLCVVEEFS